jgi:hypothetical protein
MSETPLTDAYKASREVGEDKVGWCEFARTLERDLVEARWLIQQSKTCTVASMEYFKRRDAWLVAHPSTS